MKNIAIMVGCLHKGGAERIAGSLSKELSTKYNVYLFLLDTDNIVYDHGGTIVDLAINGSGTIRYYISEYKKKLKIDCAISFLEDLNFMNIQTKGTEYVIISERCTPSEQYPRHGCQDSRIRRSYGHADKIISVSHGVKFDLISQFGIKSDKIDTIYNFIDKDQICDRMGTGLSRDLRDFAGSSEIILNVGRLTEQKNQKKLLVQFAKLIEEGEDVRLMIVGSGTLHEELSSEAERLGIDRYVKIIGYEKDPFPYYRAAAIFALTSDFEGLPNVILEAMLCGTAVVAVDCLSGPRELIKESTDYTSRVTGIEICENGILVEQADTDTTGQTDHFKRAMKRLLHDKSLRDMLARNAKKYMESYSNERISSEWVSAIESVCHSSGRVPKVVDQALAVRKVIVYGAGVVGRLVIRPYLDKEEEYDLLCFAVSEKRGNDEHICGIPVFEIGQLIQHRKDAVVLIGVSEKFQQEVADKARAYGFEDIRFPVYAPMDYLDLSRMQEWQYKDAVSKWYMEKTGERLDWKDLRTYNEKLQWIKLYDHIEEKRILTDRYQVRAYVKEKIGEQYLIPLFGCWDSFDKIDLERLPDRSVLKCTHGPRWSLLVEDKRQWDVQRAKEQIESWMMLDHAYIAGLGMEYKDLVPKIMAEKRLDDVDKGELRKYGISVFHGTARMIQVDLDRQADRKRSLYTRDWEYLEYGIGYPMASDIRVERPDRLEEMIQLSETLCRGYLHARVDLYFDGDRIYFDKMVFTPGYGVERFTSQEFAMQMGSWLLLPERS